MKNIDHKDYSKIIKTVRKLQKVVWEDWSEVQWVFLDNFLDNFWIVVVRVLHSFVISVVVH